MRAPWRQADDDLRGVQAEPALASASGTDARDFLGEGAVARKSPNRSTIEGWMPCRAQPRSSSRSSLRRRAMDSGAASSKGSAVAPSDSLPMSEASIRRYTRSKRPLRVAADFQRRRRPHQERPSAGCARGGSSLVPPLGPGGQLDGAEHPLEWAAAVLPQDAHAARLDPFVGVFLPFRREAALLGFADTACTWPAASASMRKVTGGRPMARLSRSVFVTRGHNCRGDESRSQVKSNWSRVLRESQAGSLGCAASGVGSPRISRSRSTSKSRRRSRSEASGALGQRA